MTKTLKLALLKGMLMTALGAGAVAGGLDGKTELLWPEGAPGAKGQGPADKPEITIHLPPEGKANGTAVVICPGGGYGALMMSYEGHDIAKWLNGYGIAGIVLKYRINPYGHPAPLQDAERALRLVRLHAKEWGVDSAKIGIMGFSAGGHVASTLGTHFDAGDPAAKDPAERLSCRPDFMLLVYPLITMGPKGHDGSRSVLLGRNPTQEAIDLLSNEKQVSAQTPPCFLAHSVTDQAVPVENSQMFYDALKAKGVPAEFLKLPTGPHGLGCGKGPEWEAWQKACLEWMKSRKLL